MYNLKDILLMFCAFCVFGGMLANAIFIICLFFRANQQKSKPHAPSSHPAPDESFPS